MGNQFKVDVDSLRTAGPRFSAESESLAHALSQLQSRLAGLSGMCGDDDQGHQFAAKYNPMAAQLQHMVGQMADGLGKVGTALPTMADNYERADSASKARGR
jgi:uncharacterized protein YukE